MSSGQLLTTVTIWITLVAYAFGSAAFALSRNRNRWDAAARLGWTVACVSLLAHVATAFSSYHAWSHEAAYRDTARQTYEVFGINWGGGLYVNYALLVLWIADVGWWWLRGLDAYRRRPWPIVAASQGLLIFIFFNATVVFGAGPIRWAGLFICSGLCLVWWFALRNDINGSNRRSEPPALAGGPGLKESPPANAGGSDRRNQNLLWVGGG